MKYFIIENHQGVQSLFKSNSTEEIFKRGNNQYTSSIDMIDKETYNTLSDIEKKCEEKTNNNVKGK